MQNTRERHATTLSDLVLNQGDTFYNRHRTTIEPSTPPLPPLRGGALRAVLDAARESEKQKPPAEGETRALTDEEREELADTNAIRARMRPRALSAFSEAEWLRDMLARDREALRVATRAAEAARFESHVTGKGRRRVRLRPDATLGMARAAP